MINLYEALEICLQEIAQGKDIETVLFRYPDLADELRPILEASVDAGNLGVAAPSMDVVQRNRAKVLQRASQMREAKARSSQRIWFASFRRLAVTLAVVAVLFASGTGLVRAASTTLPGDNLYPVKRTWEDVLVALTFNIQQRDALEVEHENERLQEVQELFAVGRSANVDFAGSVTSQNGNEWRVAGVPVVISAQTEILNQGIVVGSPVRVKGETRGNNVVMAERIELLPSGAQLPDAGDEPEIKQEDHEEPTPQMEDNSGQGSEGETPSLKEMETPGPATELNSESTQDGSTSGRNDSSTEVSPNSGSSHDGTDSSGDGTNSGSGGSEGSSTDH